MGPWGPMGPHRALWGPMGPMGAQGAQFHPISNIPLYSPIPLRGLANSRYTAEAAIMLVVQNPDGWVKP